MNQVIDHSGFVLSCTICIKLIDAPKSLPCLHTFCLKCLQDYCRGKKPNDLAACPQCKQEFRIPNRGLEGLFDNFLIQRIADERRSTCLRYDVALCAVCAAKSAEMRNVAMFVPPASTYCLNCVQQLCERCSIQHLMQKGTPHQVLPISDELESESEHVNGNSCKKHSGKVNEMFCVDCKENICITCLYETHQQHEWRGIQDAAQESSQAVDDHLRNVSARYDEVQKCYDEFQVKRSAWLTAIHETRQWLENEVSKPEPQQLHEQLTKIQQIELQTASVLNELVANFDQHLMRLSSFREFCAILKLKGKPWELTVTAHMLQNRADLLLQTRKPTADLYHRTTETIAFSHTKNVNPIGSERRASAAPDTGKEKISGFEGTSADVTGKCRQREILDDKLECEKEKLKTEKENCEDKQRHVETDLQTKLHESLIREQDLKRQVDREKDNAKSLHSILTEMLGEKCKELMEKAQAYNSLQAENSRLKEELAGAQNCNYQDALRQIKELKDENIKLIAEKNNTSACHCDLPYMYNDNFQQETISVSGQTDLKTTDTEKEKESSVEVIATNSIELREESVKDETAGMKDDEIRRHESGELKSRNLQKTVTKSNDLIADFQNLHQESQNGPETSQPELQNAVSSCKSSAANPPASQQISTDWKSFSTVVEIATEGAQQTQMSRSANRLCQIDSSCVVIDNGSGSIKAGFATDKMPQCVVPSVMGTPRISAHAVHGIHMDRKSNYVGAGAQGKRGVLTLKYPMENGCVSNWDEMEQIWNHVFYEELQIEPQEHPVILTAPIQHSNQHCENMARIMFETFHVPALLIANSSILALHATGRADGFVLDCGDGLTQCVPIVDGSRLISHAASRSCIAGRSLTNHLVRLLRDNDRNRFSTSSGYEIVREMKEKLCYVAQDYESELKDSTINASPESFELPDGRRIQIGDERFRCPEALFRPSVIGCDEPSIQHVVSSSIARCNSDLRHLLYSNIVLIGGTTLLPGFATRLRNELLALEPSIKKISIDEPANRTLLSWIGGTLIGSSSIFAKNCVTKQKYNECGYLAVHSKCL